MTDLFDLTDPWILTTVIASALAWAWLAWAIGGIVVDPRKLDDDIQTDSLERKRIQELRQNYASYRWFEPLVRELTNWNARLMSPRQQSEIENELTVAGARSPWKPAEYYAVKQTESLLLGLFLFTLLALVLPIAVSALVAVVIATINFGVAVYAIPQMAASQRRKFKRRLPHAVDIMALLLEAGANFGDAIKVVSREDRDTPLGREFQRVKQQLDLNRSPSDALLALKDRIRDDDTTDMIRAICNGIELGTPMSTILKTQADQMRLKRSQWGEKAAKEAEVKMTGPNLLIMIACVIVIMGPILLPIVYGGGMGF